MAVPVAAAEICREFAHEVRRGCLAVTPAVFYTVGMWYEDFGQTTDEQVRDLLRQAARVAGKNTV